ncbi:MAG: PDZ domain-containing protein [Verrucomicrobiaceae bacterium]
MRIILFHLLVGVLCISGLSAAPDKGLPWLGARIDHLKGEVERPAVMGGYGGLVIAGVIPGSPIASSGGEKGDILWKLDDQILINVSQFVTLLKMKEPGAVVKFTAFREGKERNLDVTLGVRPPCNGSHHGAKHGRGWGWHRAKTEEVAEMTDAGVHYILKETDSGLHLTVSQKDTKLFSGIIDGAGADAEVEPRWQGAVLILRQALASHSHQKRQEKSKRVRSTPPKGSESR